MSGPRDDFFTLSSRDRGWVLERVVAAARGAGTWLAEQGDEMGATQAWSEVVVTPSTMDALPGGDILRYPTARRADFLFIAPEKLRVYEFKTSSGSDTRVESLYTTALAQAGWYRNNIPQEWWPDLKRYRRAVVFRVDKNDPTWFETYERANRA
jgi:hypothetical protein